MHTLMVNHKTNAQVYEARVFGADTLLLIVAILSDQELLHLLAVSRSLGSLFAPPLTFSFLL
jgi:indole-3-glycerol phosphate synthase